MQIKGPLKISVVDSDIGSRELQLSFTGEFMAMNLQQQSEAFKTYVDEISDEISQYSEQDADYQGLLVILQVCEQLLPHIEANEIPLNETIVVNIQTHNAFGNIEISYN